MSEKVYTYAALGLVGLALVRNARVHPVYVGLFLVGQLVFWLWGRYTLKKEKEEEDA